jgi:hypothetical protein
MPIYKVLLMSGNQQLFRVDAKTAEVAELRARNPQANPDYVVPLTDATRETTTQVLDCRDYLPKDPGWYSTEELNDQANELLSEIEKAGLEETTDKRKVLLANMLLELRRRRTKEDT